MTKFDIAIFDCSIEHIPSLPRMIAHQIKLLHKMYEIDCPDVSEAGVHKITLDTPTIVIKFSKERELGNA